MEHDDPHLHSNPILETKKMIYKGNMGELINTVYMHLPVATLKGLNLGLARSCLAMIPLMIKDTSELLIIDS